MSLVGPGTLTEYEGPSRGRRQRGSVRVQKPAFGFFIAGSTIDEICGLFGQVNPHTARNITDHAVHLCYKHDQTGWLLALVESPPDEVEAERRANPYSYEEPCGMEWVFIDKTGKDLFKHKGDTIVPGAGVRWKHLHRSPESAEKAKAAREKAKIKERKAAIKRAEKQCRAEKRRMEKYQIRVEKWKEAKREEIREAKRTLQMYGGEQFEDDFNEDDIDDYLDEFDPEEAYMMGLGGYSDDESSESESESESEDEVEAAEDSMRDRGAIVESKEDDENELPWQVIALLDESILRDLRWSNAYREKRVALALAGEDVDQPPTSSIEGFLEMEKRLAIDSQASTTSAVGWLYKVVSEDGIDIYNKPEGSKVVGRRDHGDIVRVVEIVGCWLKLAPTEKAEKEKPVGIGDAVNIISGMYKGERGSVTRALDEKREVGVKLKGYTGTGTFHITEVEGQSVKPTSRPIKRNTYGFKSDSDSSSSDDDGSDEEEGVVSGGGVKTPALWVDLRSASSKTRGKHQKAESEESSPALVLVNVDAPTLIAIRSANSKPEAEAAEESPEQEDWVLAEHPDAEVYDKPFEPRLEDGASNKDEEAEESDEDDDDYVCPKSPPAITVKEPSRAAAADSDSAGGDVSTGIAVGSAVKLEGLSAEKYNGLDGVVITRRNADGRHGVRITLDGKQEQILVREKNLVCSENSAADPEMRAAAVLGLTLDTLGLNGDGLHGSDAMELLDAVLRACDRDHTANSSEKVARAAVYEAIQSHRTLKKALSERTTDPLPPAQTLRSSSAPHTSVEKGFLGKRASAAMSFASDQSSFLAMDNGVSKLKSLLAEEQARLVRHMQDWQNSWGSVIPTWKLLEAETKCAAAVIQSDNDCDDSTGGCTDDCLFLRLCILSSLAPANKNEEACQFATETIKIYPTSAAAHLWQGRCLLRLGKRDEGAAALGKCCAVAAEASGGPGGAWAHSEGTARLRSLRKAKRCEIKAKDMYERGRFEEASSLYSDAIKEYTHGGGRVGAYDDKWGRAEALVARAACHRRGRKHKEAIADCDMALDIFPKYARALFRRSICLLEAQRPKDALASLERLLRVDRKWPKLLDWLIRAAAQIKRQESGAASKSEYVDEEGEEGGGGGGGGGGEDFYAVLGVTTDATEAQLKRAYRLGSLKAHPDRAGGSTTAFQLVALAFETLSDPEKRQLYDDGVDLRKKKKKSSDLDSESDSEDEDGNKKKSLREEIERKYFPENFKFWPFGDPFIEKRRHDARKAKAAEQAKNRKANTSSRRQTWGWGGDY